MKRGKRIERVEDFVKAKKAVKGMKKKRNESIMYE